MLTNPGTLGTAAQFHPVSQTRKVVRWDKCSLSRNPFKIIPTKCVSTSVIVNFTFLVLLNNVIHVYFTDATYVCISDCFICMRYSRCMQIEEMVGNSLSTTSSFTNTITAHLVFLSKHPAWPQ